MVKKYNELDIAKGIAIIAVVLGHAFPDADYGISNLTANLIHALAYGFHMPVFFFIAGLLAAKHKEDAPAPYIKRRAAKLLIPYFVLSIIGLGLKLIFNSEANHPTSLLQSWTILFGKSPMGGMWYLWSLFVMSLIFILLIRYIKQDWLIVLIGMIMHFLQIYKTFFFMNNVMNFMVYFLLGVASKSFYDNIRDIDQRIIACAAIPTYWLCINNYAPELVQGMVGIVMILSISMVIHSTLLADIGRKSYTIYLLSYFIAIPIRVICYQRLAMNYWLVTALMFLGGFLIPYGIACLMSRKQEKHKMDLF